MSDDERSKKRKRKEHEAEPDVEAHFFTGEELDPERNRKRKHHQSGYTEDVGRKKK